jgi:hypothetical protein
MSDEDCLADLQQLAASCNFRIVQRGELFWLVGLKRGLPEVNKSGLVFSFELYCGVSANLTLAPISNSWIGLSAHRPRRVLFLARLNRGDEFPEYVQLVYSN